jgi:TolB protein
LVSGGLGNRLAHKTTGEEDGVMRREALSVLIVFLLIFVPLAGCSGGAQVPAPPEGAAAGGGNADVIAFSSRHEGNPEIYVMNLDGTGLTRLTYNENRDGYPAWSPDGSKIAFYAYEDDTTWSINLMDSDGQNRVRLTYETNVRHASPVWSPDGTTIAFSRMSESSAQIWLVDADGGNPRRLGELEGFAPQWSPDGKWFAFCTTPVGEIHVAGADGSNPRQLTDNEVDDMWPAWSPDGSKIAFMSGENEHHQIWVMNFDGSEKTRLTNNSFDDWRPIWSPDGARIAFMSFRGDIAGVFLMGGDGGDERHLTPFSDYAMQVAWRPTSSP